MPHKLVNKDLPLNLIRVSPLLYEREITDADIEDMASSIEQIGQLEQVLVRPIGKAKQKYELLAGKRRYLALSRLRAKTIRCAIIKCDDDEARILSLTENLKQKNLTPRERQQAEAELFTLLHKKFDQEEPPPPPPENKPAKETKKTTKELLGPGRKKSARTKAIEETAKIVGRSPREVERDLKLRDQLISSASRALDQGRITQKQALRLAGMSADKQRRELLQMYKESQEETANRLAIEQTAKDAGETETAKFLLEEVIDACKLAMTKSNQFMKLVDGKDIRYKVLRKLSLATLTDCAQLLQQLHTFVSED